MIKSMTGYGRGEVKDKEGECLVEAKSVNHRFLEIKTKFPQRLTEIEDIVKKKIKESFSRGYFEVYVSFERLNNIEVELNHLLQLNGILKFEELNSDTLKSESYIKFLEKALDGAINSLKDMREKEGVILDRDITERLKIINDHINILKGKQTELIDGFRTRFSERLKKMLEGKEIPSDRLSEEVAIMAERSDITEELIRLE